MQRHTDSITSIPFQQQRCWASLHALCFLRYWELGPPRGTGSKQRASNLVSRSIPALTRPKSKFDLCIISIDTCTGVDEQAICGWQVVERWGFCFDEDGYILQGDQGISKRWGNRTAGESSEIVTGEAGAQQGHTSRRFDLGSMSMTTIGSWLCIRWFSRKKQGTNAYHVFATMDGFNDQLKDEDEANNAYWQP